MKRLSAQSQMYLAIAVVALMTVAAVFFGILPNFQSAASMDAEIETEKQNLATAQALVARRQSAKSQSAADEAELMHIANQMPDAPHLPAVIIELQDVANAAGVELPQISVGDLGPPRPTADGSTPAYNTLDISIAFEGAWSEVIDFCRRLNDLDRGVRVVSATFGYVPDEDGDSYFVQGTATLQVYMMLPASATPESATAVTTGQ